MTNMTASTLLTGKPSGFAVDGACSRGTNWSYQPQHIEVAGG
jgi:hypothetical protein